MDSRYEYATELEYQLHTYEDKIKFAKYQVESQLDKALMRKKDEEFELKLYGGVLLFIVLLLPLSFIMSLGMWNFLALLGVPLLFIAIAGWIFAMPVCVYKVIKGTLLYSINRQNKLGQWLMKKYGIPFCNTEINTCQTYLNKYKVLLENIEHWREKSGEGQMEFSGEQILEQLKAVELDPRIEIATMRWGNMMRFIRRTTIIAMAVIYPLIVFLEFSVLMKTNRTIYELFRQL